MSEIFTIKKDKIRMAYCLLFAAAHNRQHWSHPINCRGNNCLESCRQVKYRNCSLLLSSVTYQNCVSRSTWIKAVGFTRAFEKMDGSYFCLVSMPSTLHPLPPLCNLIKGHSAHTAVSKTFLTFLQKCSLQTVVIYSCNGAKKMILVTMHEHLYPSMWDQNFVHKLWKIFFFPSLFSTVGGSCFFMLQMCCCRKHDQ